MKYTLAIFSLLTPSLFAALSLGTINDFQDGTTQGWAGGASPVNIADGGPLGAGDNFLQIGDGGNLATFNTGADFSGVLSPTTTNISVSLMRPATDTGSLDIRLVLFGPGTGNRWTSTTPASVPNDGIWRTFTFSTLEADLTQVAGSASFSDLAADVNRTMFRHDPGTPSAGGTSVSGTLGIDNITVIPEPSSLTLLALACLGLMRHRR